MQVEEVALKGNTIIFGDPSKPGMYVVRARLTANQTARPLRATKRTATRFIAIGAWYKGAMAPTSPISRGSTTRYSP